jgi:cytochrome c
MKSFKGYFRLATVVLVLAWALLACSIGGFGPQSIPSLQPLSTLEAAATSLVGTAQPLLTTLEPTLQALASQVGPTFEAAVTEIVPTLEAVATEVAPTSSAPTAQVSPGATPRLGSPADAQAMLKKAVEHYNTVGRKQALADFTGRVAPFFDRDLYVACIDANLKQSANGGFPNLVGSSTQPLSRAAWDAATTTTIGTVNYNWIDPETNQTLPKTFYYEKVGVDVCGVGAYHP